jgi:uncharacterized protein (DUF1501 family)
MEPFVKNASYSRRSLLRASIASTCGGLIHRVAPPVGGIIGWGISSHARAALSPSTVLILVNLLGGASYNLTPIYHGTYRDKNKSISYGPEGSLPLTSDQGLHPSLTSLKGVYDEGNLALLNMVGYPNPNRSHAESMEIWYRGTLKNSLTGTDGWAARMTCELGGAFSGVSLGGLSTLHSGLCNPPRALSGLDSLGDPNFLGEAYGEWVRITRANFAAAQGNDTSPSMKFVQDEMNEADISSERMRAELKPELPTISNPFPKQGWGFQFACRDAARLIQARGLNVRFIYLERGNFDTHANEKKVLTENLDDLNSGLRSLIQSIKAMGRWNDVVIATMSEFSRTWENGSGGTDHGHAGPLLIAGGAIKGGQKNPVPTPKEVESSIFLSSYQIDFRQVFREIVGGMGLDANKVFPESATTSRALNLF